MLKKFLLILFSFFFLFPNKIFASGFQLKTIGGLDVDGVTISHIWYSGQNPTITGIATAYSDINISVDGSAQKVSADSSGRWIFHSVLADGDHNLTFTNNGVIISKTITIGKNFPENIGSLPKAESPTVGNINPTILLGIMGVILIFSPKLLFRKK